MASHPVAGFGAERKISNVLLEDDRWLLPAWESLTDPDDAGIAKTLDLVAETSRLLAAKNILLLLVAIPFKARYCPTLAASEIAPSVSSRYARALEAMRSRSIATVDLDAALRPVQTSDRTIYYRTDQHWTSEAVDAAGTAIAQTIRTAASIPDGGRHDALGAYVSESHIGDLATLLPPAEQAAVGLEKYRLRTAYDADLTGYDLFYGRLAEPDATTMVQIAGSSFVRPMWGLPQKMSSLLGRRVGLTFFNGDSGPYHTLLMNLRGTPVVDRPRVIVWQMTEANLHLGPSATGWWSISSLMSTDFFLSKVNDAVK